VNGVFFVLLENFSIDVVEWGQFGFILSKYFCCKFEQICLKFADLLCACTKKPSCGIYHTKSRR
ncbi:MAG: hypothetical protein IKA29_01780, partial [Clostridia bacterium]|nr:hypothetical protein [Clostridia bacterium]